ncbi:hypothetical protein HZS_7096 [Henneguya salminicola]|nr:hypothetical protein HZS_7096 [Henneguya salminicola]
MRYLQNTNIKSHYTEMYNYHGLLFRRGIPFTIEVSCISFRTIDLTSVNLSLNACGCGEKKMILDKNYACSENYGWSYDVLKNSGVDGTISISVTSPSNAIVGKYKIYVLMSGREIGSTEFILIFNPFHPDDDVYLPNFDDIQEYVLNDTTKIYMGTEDYIIPKEWDVGQFEPGSIEACVLLLSIMPASTRTTAVEVSRQLSALINSNDDNGVIIGNWSGKYSDGTNPMAWHGSAEILTKYSQSGRPVRYGQCWVFTGVLCTVLRTLGIPSRCVTNYCSLHDSDGSLKWEIYLDSEFNVISTAGDSCWNFHCWNEAWIRRKDIGSSHDGWQVLDATPQERSGGLFRLGPASKVAVRNGQIDLPYDVGFVYAEVNADKVFFLRQPDGTFKRYMVKKNELGKMILTKKRLSDDMEDITAEYKCSGSSTMDSLIDAEHSIMRMNENSITRNIKLEILCPSNISLTDDLYGTIIVRGLSERRVNILKAEALLVSYTGRNICKLYDATENISTSEKRLEFKIKQDMLGGSINEEFPFIKIKAYCFDSNNDELGYCEKVVSVKTPDLEISGIPTACRVDSNVMCTVSILNTLNRPLSHVRLCVKFTDDKPKRLRLRSILPGKKLVQDILLTPKTVGLKKLQISMESKECCGFSSAAKFKAIL